MNFFRMYVECFLRLYALYWHNNETFLQFNLFINKLVKNSSIFLFLQVDGKLCCYCCFYYVRKQKSRRKCLFIVRFES